MPCHARTRTCQHCVPLHGSYFHPTAVLPYTSTSTEKPLARVVGALGPQNLRLFHFSSNPRGCCDAIRELLHSWVGREQHNNTASTPLGSAPAASPR